MECFEGVGGKEISRVLDILALQEFVGRIRLGILMGYGFQIVVPVFKSAVNLVDGALGSVAFESRECLDQRETRDQKHDGQEGSQSHR